MHSFQLRGERLILVGAGTFAQSLCRIVRCGRQFRLAGFVVDEEYVKSSSKSLCVPLIPLGAESLAEFSPSRHMAFVAVGPDQMSLTRQILVERVRAMGYRLASIVSEGADVPSELLRENTYVGSGARISQEAEIGEGTVVHENAVISAHASIGPYAYVGPGALVGSYARIGSHTVLGAGSVVKTHTEVGSASLIGAGCYVSRDVPSKSLVIRKGDVPAGTFGSAVLSKLLEGSG